MHRSSYLVLAFVPVLLFASGVGAAKSVSGVESIEASQVVDPASPASTWTDDWVSTAFIEPTEWLPAPGEVHWNGTPTTGTDWQLLIDNAWGEGLTTAEKLLIFDSFWDEIDLRYACFHDIEDRWAELRTLYRDEVAGGVSRGRFGAILGQLSLSLQESHAGAGDIGINSTRPRHGIPRFFLSPVGLPAGFLGAAVTGLDDGTGLVYRIDADNPLGLEPGDIIVGYEGRPWLELRDELLAYELPIAGSPASSPEGIASMWAGAVGANWHLFDTMDVIKYSSGHLEAVHFPGLG